MKKLCKALAMVLSVSLLVAAMASCSKEADVVICATNAEFPPFEFIAENGVIDHYDGVDMAIAVEIAKDMGKTLRVDNMEFESVLAAVPTGKATFAAAGMTAKEERKVSMDFSEPYYEAAQIIIVPKDNTDITSATDLLTKEVGVVTAYTGASVCADLGVKDLQHYKKGLDAVMDLENGKLEAVVIDNFTAKALVAKSDALKLVEDTSAFESEFYCIAVKKGDTQTLEVVNKTIKRMIDDGSIDALIEKYGTIE